MSSIRAALLDTTLRDGGYAVDFQFEEHVVTHVLDRLDESPVSMVEVGHGLGYEAERSGVRTCNITLERWCELANEHLAGTAWGMFAQPDFSRLATLSTLCAEGMRFVRVGMEPHRVQENLGYLNDAVERCDEVYLNLMKTTDVPSQDLPDLLRDVPSEISGVYVVDSNGAMLPDDVRRYVERAREARDRVGFHGHDNLGLATANSLAALEAGAALVDATLNGIGRGAGNASLEALAAIIALRGEDRYDYQDLAELAEYCRTEMDVVCNERDLQVLGGVLGVHTGLFPYLQEVCAEYGADPASVMQQAVSASAHSPGKQDIQAAARAVGKPSDSTSAATGKAGS